MSGRPPAGPAPEPDAATATGRLIAALLPAVAVGVFVLGTAVTLAAAGDTLGYDFAAYHAAAVRVLGGASAYDQAFQVAGPYGLFLYPPTFIPLVLAFGLLPLQAATWAWLVLLGAAFAAGVAVLPVRVRTRWWIVLLAGQSWPFLYGLKLGQVAPLLFLLFAVGWRRLASPGVLGATGAMGAAIKLQPGLVLVWAALTRRWAALVWAGIVLVALAAVATVVAGPGSWADFTGLVTRVSDPIMTPHNFTPGAVAYQLGLGRDAASVVQWAAMAAVAVAVVAAAFTIEAVPSYLVAVTASQLLSPILWDHYAMLLLLPVAWLIERGHWWAAAIPLVTSVVLVGAIPAVAYPAAFGVTLLALLVVGRRDVRVAPTFAPAGAPA